MPPHSPARRGAPGGTTGADDPGPGTPGSDGNGPGGNRSGEDRPGESGPGEKGPVSPAGARAVAGTAPSAGGPRDGDGGPSGRDAGASRPPRAAALRIRVQEAALVAMPALVVYAIVSAVHLAVLAWMTPEDQSVRDRLLSWDAAHYVDVAAHGYPDHFTYTDQGELTGNTLAFFPLFPGLVRLVAMVTGLDPGGAGLLAAHLATAAGLVVLHMLITRLYDGRTATIMVVLVAGAQPMGIVFSMAYSETLFLALAAGVLLAAHRQAWLTAGVLAALAGLTRPAALAVTAALAVAALMAMVRARRVLWRPLAACVIACTGTPAYLMWVGLRLGRLDAWFLIQDKGWGTRWDYGRQFYHFVADTLRDGDGWIAVSTAVLIPLLVVAALLAVDRTTWPPFAVYGLSVLVLTIAQSNYYHSKLRLLIPALLFLVPAARALARARNRTVVVVLAAATLVGTWYGAYMLTTWGYGI